MARTRTLDDLIAASRRQADMEVSTFVSDAEVTFIVNQRIAQLYDMLVAADPDRYIVEDTVTTTSGDPPWTATLPEDFYVLRGVDLQRGRSRYPLEPYQLQEREMFGSTDWPFISRAPMRYRVAGNGIDGVDAALHFDTNPGNSTFVVYYVPNPPILVDGEDVLDGFAAWEDWVIYKTAISLLNKEESDASALERECAQIEQRIKHMAAMRDAGSAPQVADVRFNSSGSRWPR